MKEARRGLGGGGARRGLGEDGAWRCRSGAAKRTWCLGFRCSGGSILWFRFNCFWLRFIFYFFKFGLV